MIRFAIPPIGGEGWYGGWNYMGNLVRNLSAFGDPEIEICLFMGLDRIRDPLIEDLSKLERVRVICHPAFNEDRVRSGQMKAMMTGRNGELLDAYYMQGIDVAFAPATYLGWRRGVPAIAWFPDFQHRRLPEMFSQFAWWKREIGFQAQARASAAILLSSADAERDCLRFYPIAKGRTVVARFAIPADDWPSPKEALQRLQTEGIEKDFIFLPNQLWQHKNHELAIAAAGELARHGSSKRILATGHGVDPRRPGYRNLLEALVVQYGASANFQFLGSVDRHFVKCLAIGANALLNPSQFEGWSTTVEEAKAIGTPLILSNISVHREQAPSAAFVDLEDAVQLAATIERTQPRNIQQIIEDMETAKHSVEENQKKFAQIISKSITMIHQRQSKLP